MLGNSVFMSYPINQKINPYPQTSTGIANPQLQDLDGVKKGISNNTVVKGITNNDEKNKNLGHILTLPIWGAMAWAMEKFNNACKGSFDESLVGKVSSWAEKKGAKIENKTAFLDRFTNRIGALKESFMTKVVPRSRILNAFFNTPTKPEFSGALMMYGGTKSEISADAAQKLEKYTEDGKIHLEQFGLTPEEFKEITKKSSEPKNIKKLIEIFEKQGKDTHFELPWEIPMTGIKLNKFFPKATTKIYWSSYVNKLKVFNNGNKTFLGKKLPNAMLRTIEGITNGTAGGKFAILMAAMFIGDAIRDSINAPKGDKISTFAESNINGIGFYLLMPFCMGIMHKLGGLKYLGMNEEQVKAYREALKNFNEKATSGVFSNKAEYKAARKELQEMLKGEISGSKTAQFFKNLVYKPLKKAANVLTVGLEVPKAFNPKAINPEAKLGEKLARIFRYEKSYTLKKGLGFLRAPLVMLAIAPPFLHLATKASHLIFGKPAKSLLDDETKKEEQPKNPIVPINPQQPRIQSNQAMQPLNQNMEMNKIIDYGPRQNLVDLYKQNPVEHKEAPVQKEYLRTYNYMPSSAPVKIDPNANRAQDEKTEKAFKKADIAEKAANQYTPHH